MARPLPRFREGNTLRLAHARTTSIDQTRLSTSSPLFSPARYEPLSPASPRQPLLSPSAVSWTGSLPPSPSSPEFSDGNVSSSDRRRMRSRSGPSLLPVTNIPRKQAARLRILAPLAFVSTILAIGLLGVLSSKSAGEIREYSSRLYQGLRGGRAEATGESTGNAPSSPSLPPFTSPPPNGLPLEPVATATVDSTTTLVDVDLRTIPISTLPRLAPPIRNPETKYLGYLPHSGFHNQRMELQSALLLGKALNRTVLVPPVWIGWPVPTRYYPDLRQSWLEIMLSTPQSFNISDLRDGSPLSEPIDARSSVDDFPCPTCDADNDELVAKQQEHEAQTRAKWLAMGYEIRADGFPVVPGLTAEDCKSYSPECRSTYLDTFLGWDFLVELDKAREVGVDMASRWDMRERPLIETLGLQADDIYILEDRQKYDFRFTDEIDADQPMIVANNNTSHWNRDVSIAALKTLPQRVLLVGSLYGSGRVSLTKEPDAPSWMSALAQSMAFSNPWLIRPADAIVERLGGRDNFVGVHARVGDGQFARHARANMEQAWRALVDHLGVDQADADEMWQRVEPAPEPVVTTRSRGRPRSNKGDLAAVAPESSTWQALESTSDASKDARSNPKAAKRGVVDEIWRTIFGSEGSPLANNLRNLSCRASLHTEHRYSALNTPLYLATDSRDPEADENLAAFFAAFPCTFILSDFTSPDPTRNDGIIVKSVSEMTRLVNALDSVPLGRLFLPFLEAIVAAKARVTVGTDKSTFSAFAAGDLHEAYRAHL